MLRVLRRRIMLLVEGVPNRLQLRGHHLVQLGSAEPPRVVGLPELGAVSDGNLRSAAPARCR